MASMSPQERSHSTIGISIPSWLAGTEEACHIVDAAERTFGRLVRIESSPSAVYTAAGYELCRISYEAFECSVPERLMTVELDGGIAVATMVQTPIMDVFKNTVTYAVRRWPDIREPGSESDVDDLVRWVDDFVEAQKVDMLMLAGSAANDPLLVEALKSPKIGRLMDSHAGVLPIRDIVALGTALAAKDAIESQIDHCGEPMECEEIGREADRIGGKYSPLATPPCWPARSHCTEL